MPKISHIKFKDITEARRYDVEYFKPEYLETLTKIRKHRFLPNNKVSLIKSGTTPKERDENLKDGVVLLKTGNIRNNTLQYERDHKVARK